MVYFEVKKTYKSEKRVLISFLEKVIGKQFEFAKIRNTESKFTHLTKIFSENSFFIW